MTSIRTYIHCLTCRNFVKCKRRYVPEEGPIFTAFSTKVDENGQELFVLSDKVWCKRPLKDVKKG